MSYYNKYLKYKEKYLELKGGIDSEKLLTRLPGVIKPKIFDFDNMKQMLITISANKELHSLRNDPGLKFRVKTIEITNDQNLELILSFVDKKFICDTLIIKLPTFTRIRLDNLLDKLVKPELKTFNLINCDKMENNDILQISTQLNYLHVSDLRNCTFILDFDDIKQINTILSNDTAIHLKYNPEFKFCMKTILITINDTYLLSFPNEKFIIDTFKYRLGPGPHDPNLLFEYLNKLVKPKLKTLDLLKCLELTDKELARIANDFPSLQHLNLNLCENITDTGLATISKNFTELKTLTVANYFKITPAGLRQLAKNLPALGIIIKENNY